MRILAFLLLFSSSLHAAGLQVFAAASLNDALKEIAVKYEKSNPDHVVFNFGASSLLARQIEEGAPADVFFSADEQKMDALEKESLILPGTRKSVLSNTLVIVVPSDSGVKIDSPQKLASSNWKIAIAEPATVPAGIYAKQYLSKIGIWSKVIDRVIPTENVRAALAAVESGNVDVGIVYKTDARISRRVKIAYEIPRSEGPDISYPVAVIRESRNLDAAKKFAAYLSTDEALAVFRKYEFLIR